MTHAVAFAAIRTTNDEDTRTFCGKFLYNAVASTDNAQHKTCSSSGIDDRPGRDLFKVLKRSPNSQPHTLGLRRGYSDGKAVGNTTGLRRRLHPHWRISLLQSLCRALGQTEASYQSCVTTDNRVHKLSSLIKMAKWHAHVVHMAKHMNMAGGHWARPLLNPALARRLDCLRPVPSLE